MKVFFCAFSAIALMLTASATVSAAVIASQTFDTDQRFNEAEDGVNGTAGGYTDGISNDRGTYVGSGLGFFGAAATSTTETFGTIGGVFEATHLSSFSDVVSHTGDKYSVAEGSADGEFNNVDNSGYLLFDVVDTTGYENSTMTIDLVDLTTENHEQDLVVRVFLDGSATGIDLFHWNGTDGSSGIVANVLDASTTFDGTTLTYTIDNSVSSVELYVPMMADDDNNGWQIDNVSFNGTAAVPEPTSLALLGLFGMGMFVRRKR